MKEKIETAFKCPILPKDSKITSTDPFYENVLRTDIVPKHTHNPTLIIIADLICTLIFNLFIMGGCAYVVFGLNHSGWWFLLAILLMASWGSEGNNQGI